MSAVKPVCHKTPSAKSAWPEVKAFKVPNKVSCRKRSRVGDFRAKKASHSSINTVREMMLSAATVSTASQPVATRLMRLATASTSLKSRPASCSKACPAAVGCACLALRSKSSTSKASSICLTRYVSALGTSPSTRAAAAKLPLLPMVCSMAKASGVNISRGFCMIE